MYSIYQLTCFIIIFFLAFGFAPYSNFDEDDDDDSEYLGGKSLSDDDISEFCDTVTGISEVDGATSEIIGGGYYDQDASVMTGNKSQAFLARKGGSGKSPTSILRNSPKKSASTKHYSSTFTPEYILDTWKDSRPNNRCSISFLIESGHNRHKDLKVRVSTDGNFLVISKKMSNIALSAQIGIKDLILRKDKTFQNDKIKAKLLDNHSRIIGRKSSVATICNRNVSRQPQVDLEARIPLPFRCRKTFSKKDNGDELFFGKKFVRFDDQSFWCTCHLISNVSDGYKAMDDIPEEDVINIIDDHVKVPSASSTFSKTNEFSTQGSFSVGTVKTFHTPASRSPTAAGKSTNVSSGINPMTPVQEKSPTATKKEHEDTIPQQNNTLEYFLKSASSKIIKNSVYLSPTNNSNGTNSDYFSTPPENKPIPPTVTCMTTTSTNKVRTDQRKREKSGRKKMLRSGKQYGTSSNESTTTNDSSIFSRTSKAMKMMVLTDNHHDNKSVGTLSMDGDSGSVSLNLKKLSAAQDKIDNEINDLAQY